jgi:hypothetical protein
MAEKEDIVDCLKRQEVLFDQEGLYVKATIMWEAYQEIERLRAELAYHLKQRNLEVVGKEWGTPTLTTAQVAENLKDYRPM